MVDFKISKNKFTRLFYLIFGFFNIVMGIIGLFLPVWPTTVFLILAAWSFMRSSEKYYFWLINNKIFGKFIYNYYHYRGITQKSRLKSLFFTWISLTGTIIIIDNLWIRLLMLVIGIGVTWHLYALKTLTKEEADGQYHEFNESRRAGIRS